MERITFCVVHKMTFPPRSYFNYHPCISKRGEQRRNQSLSKINPMTTLYSDAKPFLNANTKTFGALKKIQITTSQFCKTELNIFPVKFTFKGDFNLKFSRAESIRSVFVPIKRISINVLRPTRAPSVYPFTKSAPLCSGYLNFPL